MTRDSHSVETLLWAAFVLSCSLLFLGVGFIKTSVVVLFVLVSCAISFGRRRLLQASFLVSLVAIAIFLGFPAPNEWLGLMHSTFELGRSQITLR